MDIKNRLYPHPVLVEGSDDYVNSSFDFVVEPEKLLREIKFSFKMNLTNKGLRELINNNEAEYLIHFEASRTCYRNVLCSQDDNFSIRIPERDLNGKVTINGFIVTKKDLPAYSNQNLNEDYKGITFNIDKGSIMAIGGHYDLKINKDAEELTKLPSIFNICKYAADTDESMKIDMDGHKINIALSEGSFQNYKLSAGMASLQPVFHSIIILPALVYVFETLKHEGFEAYDDRRWLAAIRKTLAQYEIELNEETLENNTSYNLAQRLLDFPIDRALTALVELDEVEDEEED